MPPARQLHEAIDEFTTAVRLAPRNADYRYSLASALDRVGETQVALAQWRMELALLPRTPTTVVAEGVRTNNAQALLGAYSSLARDLALAGATAEADQDYQAALRWEPTYDDVRLDYADFLNKHGKRNQARQQWQKVIANHGYEVAQAKTMLEKYPST